MVFFFISFLLLISLFCTPFSFRIRLSLGGRDIILHSVININRILDIFPEKKMKSKKSVCQRKFPLNIKIVPSKSLFDMLKIYEFKLICHNISQYNVIAYNMFVVFLQQFAALLRLKGSLYDFEFLNTEGIDRIPRIQLKIHFKINLLIIFSSIFKIIRIEVNK